MTIDKKTITVLLICLLVLCYICFQTRPLIFGRHSDELVKFSRAITKTEIGHKLTKHYSQQLGFHNQLKVGPYKDLKPSEPEKVNLVFARLVFAGLIALFASVISLILFIINGMRKQEPVVSKSTLFFTLLLIVLCGTMVRLLMASAVYGNYDMQSYEIVADIVIKGGNVYAETGRYNYSPLWFTVLAVLKRIQLHFPDHSFHFVVRAFLCSVDLLTLVFLLFIASGQKISMIKTAIFFYLNPVSFLITGYHGQFENLAVLMVIIGLFAYLKLKSNPILGKIFLWIFATAGMIVKHNIFYELIICLNSAIKRRWVKLSLFVISACIFLALFLPYWGSESRGEIKNLDGSTFEGSSEGIIANVFMYASGDGFYGITSLFRCRILKYIFIVGMFIFPLFLKNKDIIAQCLLGALFFLTFTTGISIQYFVIPIALGTLRPSKGFMLYSLVGSSFILGDVNNVYVPVFHLFRWNIVWIGAIYWFVTEYRITEGAPKLLQTLRKGLYNRINKAD